MHKFINILFTIALLIMMAACGLLSSNEQNEPINEKRSSQPQDQTSRTSSEQNNVTIPSDVEISKTQKDVIITVKKVEKAGNNVKIHLKIDNYTQKDLHTGLSRAEVKQGSDMFFPIKKEDITYFREPSGESMMPAGTTGEGFVTFTIADPNAPFLFKIDPAISSSMVDIESIGPFEFNL